MWIGRELVKMLQNRLKLIELCPGKSADFFELCSNPDSKILRAVRGPIWGKYTEFIIDMVPPNLGDALRDRRPLPLNHITIEREWSSLAPGPKFGGLNCSRLDFMIFRC